MKRLIFTVVLLTIVCTLWSVSILFFVLSLEKTFFHKERHSGFTDMLVKSDKIKFYTYHLIYWRPCLTAEMARN